MGILSEATLESVRSGELGIITDVQHFTVHDGPGIRTMAFFKGCPLRCKWCHNPETWNIAPQLMQVRSCCVGCGRCLEVCPKGALHRTSEGIIIDRELCDDCGMCTEVCYSKALSMAGRFVSVDELYRELLDDETFYRNGQGGVTLSGGECTMQAEFIIKLLQKLKEHGTHTAIETCGFCDPKQFLRIMEYVDLVLFDIKVLDEMRSKFYVGQGTAVILENLNRIRKAGKETVIRFPLIPEVNDDEESLQMVVRIAQENDIKRLNIMPFHQLGASKWSGIGRTYTMADMEEIAEEKIQYALRFFLQHGLDASVGGSKA